MIPAKGQFWEFNRWKPHKNWKAAEKKDTYDPTLMILEDWRSSTIDNPLNILISTWLNKWDISFASNIQNPVWYDQMNTEEEFCDFKVWDEIDTKHVKSLSLAWL